MSFASSPFRRLLLAALPLCAACAPARYVDEADREVETLLDRFERRGLAPHWDSLEMPDRVTREEMTESLETETTLGDQVAGEPMLLDLERAIRVAVESGRDYLSRKETLYLSGLGFTLTRFRFGPQLSSAINAVWSDGAGRARNYSLGSNLGVSQILPTGGTISADVGLGAGRTEGPFFGDPDKGRSVNSNVGIRLNQPLLRGAGYAVTHEALVQGERSLIYALRDFELFRQDYSIDIASRFFDLVNQKKSLAIQQQRSNDAQRDLDKAEALREMERNRKNDVFIARRSANNEKNTLIEARVQYQRALDRFAIDLGLPRGTPIDIVEESPNYQPTAYEPESAIAAALTNRLDIQTQRDQLEDVDRGVRLTQNTLLPNLDLNVSYGLNENGGRRAIGGVVDAGSPWNTTASLGLSIPIQQEGVRNQYRSALIQQDRAHRNFEQFIDQQVADIENLLRRLARNEEQIELQRELIKAEEESIAVVKIQLESGEASNRDLNEARQSLANAQNQLNRLLSDHFLDRLRLQRSLGTLVLDETGMWPW